MNLCVSTTSTHGHESAAGGQWCVWGAISAYLRLPFWSFVIRSVIFCRATVFKKSVIVSDGDDNDGDGVMQSCNGCGRR